MEQSSTKYKLKACEDYVDDDTSPDFDAYTSPARKALFNISLVLGFKKEAELRKAMLLEITREPDLPESEIRTVFTRVMQRLGYEGIDVRQARQFDNGTFGSVIFLKSS